MAFRQPQPRPKDHDTDPKTPRAARLCQYLAEQDAHDQAAELELQYDAHGYRSAETVQRVDSPVPVERAWKVAGVLDAWVRENGEWIGRVRGADGRIVWIRGAEVRQPKGA
jgi:YD repeat-containing protein